MTIELQEEYDLLLEERKNIQSKIDGFINKAKENGFYIKKDKVKKNEVAYGCFYDTTFYSHFDGESSDAIYDYYSGVESIDIVGFQSIKQIINNYDTLSPSSIFELLNLAVNGMLPGGFDEELYESEKYEKEENHIGDLKFEIRNDYLHISIDKEDDNEQCSLTNGSYLEFRPTTMSEINSTKTIQEESRG